MAISPRNGERFCHRSVTLGVSNAVDVVSSSVHMLRRCGTCKASDSWNLTSFTNGFTLHFVWSVGEQSSQQRQMQKLSLEGSSGLFRVHLFLGLFFRVHWTIRKSVAIGQLQQTKLKEGQFCDSLELPKLHKVCKRKSWLMLARIVLTQHDRN